MLAPRISGTASGLWPTPVANDTGLRKKPYAQGGTALSLAALTWPTPRSCSAMAASITPEAAWAPNRFPNLETVVGRRLWPRPCATDFKGISKPGQRRGQLTDPNAGAIPAGGALNPTWVEWLMGWPIGWTDLKPWATDRCQPAPQQRGECLQEAEA